MSDLKVRRLLRGLALFSGLWLMAASVHAQGIVLMSDGDVPAGITRSVKRRLGQVADVTDHKGTEQSDAGFSRIAKRKGAALIVHLRLSDERELQAELRQGASGAVVTTREFPIQGRRLKQPARALSALVAAAREQLSQSGAPPAVAARDTQEQDDEPLDDEPSEASAPAPRAAEPSAAESPAFEPASSEGEQIMDDPELSARLAARPKDGDAGPRQGLSLQASVGIGPGVHALSVPAPGAAGEPGQLDTGLAPAVSLAAAAQLGLGQWLLRAEAQYRTFFAGAPYGQMTQTMNGTTQETLSSPITSHSFVIGASPGYRFGGRDSVALTMLVGWTFRSLHAALEALPGASLRGFVARPALHIPFGDGLFNLRLAPELIVVQSSETNALGYGAEQASGGLGWGVEAAVDVRLAKLLGAGLQYRRSRIAATRASPGSAIDEEWYVAVQAVLSL